MCLLITLMPHNVALWLPPSLVAASWPVDQCETSANVVAEAEAALMGTGYTANTLQAFKPYYLILIREANAAGQVRLVRLVGQHATALNRNQIADTTAIHFRRRKRHIQWGKCEKIAEKIKKKIVILMKF